MTPRMEALDALIDAVANGTVEQKHISSVWWHWDDDFAVRKTPFHHAISSLEGSTDAALDLLAEVLPDWWPERMGYNPETGVWQVVLITDPPLGKHKNPAVISVKKVLHTAILLAILKALRTQEET